MGDVSIIREVASREPLQNTSVVLSGCLTVTEHTADYISLDHQ